jgi:hypothetical protein
VRVRNYAFAIALTFFPAQVLAAEKAAWSGSGTMACAEVTGALQQHPEDENLFFSWAQGFMSGLNTDLLKHGETDLNSLPLDAQKQFVRSYCKEHPRAPYFEAVFKLFDKMRHDQGLPRYVHGWREPQNK